MPCGNLAGAIGKRGVAGEQQACWALRPFSQVWEKRLFLDCRRKHWAYCLERWRIFKHGGERASQSSGEASHAWIRARAKIGGAIGKGFMGKACWDIFHAARREILRQVKPEMS